MLQGIRRTQVEPPRSSISQVSLAISPRRMPVRKARVTNSAMVTGVCDIADRIERGEELPRAGVSRLLKAVAHALESNGRAFWPVARRPQKTAA
jgi:hypothetical protein